MVYNGRRRSDLHVRISCKCEVLGLVRPFLQQTLLGLWLRRSRVRDQGRKPYGRSSSPL
jgi:hypothetical protein